LAHGFYQTHQKSKADKNPERLDPDAVIGQVKPRCLEKLLGVEMAGTTDTQTLRMIESYRTTLPERNDLRELAADLV
jgi:hypothetical protein